MAEKSRLAQRMQRVSSSAIMELLKATAKGNYISFASGLPDPNLFPATQVASITESLLATESHTALQYGAAEGYAPLREWVAERLRQRGISHATPEHILITNGSQQALDLVARLFLERGSRVMVEAPTYLAALQTFDSYEVEYASLSMDKEGICVEEARSVLAKEQIALAFMLPNFQNPSGITQSIERRERLAESLAERQTPLLEDDAYYDLRYSGTPLPPLNALAKNPHAVYTGTFSKIIAPGLRVGYLCADPALVSRLAQLKQITDLHTGSLTQRIVYQFCAKGYLEPQITHQNAVYRRRRDILLEALAKHFGSTVQWTNPDGGMFVLLTLPERMDATALLKKAMEQGIVYVPASSFFPQGGGANLLRLNFVSATEEAIQQGIAILAEVVHHA